MKTLQPMLAVLIFTLNGLLGGTSARLHAADAKPPIYLVVFRLTLGADAKLQDLQTLKVIDLLSGSNNAVSVEPPQTFINDARKQVESQAFKSAVQGGRTSTTLTTFAHAPAVAGSAAPRISLAALDGVLNTTSNLRLLGQDGQMSSFGKDLSNAAFFLLYYALPSLPKETKEQREAIIEAEIQRNAANVQNAEILSKKNLSTDTQTIVEITAKSPRNKALTIRTRYLCNDRQMLALVAVTPDGLPVDDIQSFDRMIEDFRFR